MDKFYILISDDYGFSIYLEGKKLYVTKDVSDRDLWSFLLHCWKDDDLKLYKNSIPVVGIDDSNGGFKIIWDTEWEIIKYDSMEDMFRFISTLDTFNASGKIEIHTI